MFTGGVFLSLLDILVVVLLLLVVALNREEL